MENREHLEMKPTPSEMMKRADGEGRYELPDYVECIDGLHALDPRLEAQREAEIVERARQAWLENKRIEQIRQDQYIVFKCTPACLVFFADQHCGGEGVNYPRMYDEAQLAADMPGTLIGLVGDAVDQFIIGRLRQVALHESRIKPWEEWYLIKHYLDIVAGKLALAVPGNHPNWFEVLTGVPYFRRVMSAFNPSTLYHSHEINAVVRVPGASWKMKVRHRWRGRSIYNHTHGIERGAKWDGGFDLGVGAHNHDGAYCRDINVGGKPGLAAMCGTYKEVDSYAQDLGFPRNNGLTGVAVIFNGKTGRMLGTTDLEWAAAYMTEALA